MTMPAPKSPNTAAATQAAAAVARRRGDETAATRLRERGWFVLTPEQWAVLPDEIKAMLVIRPG